MFRASVPFHRQLSRLREIENEREHYLFVSRSTFSQIPTVNEGTTTRTRYRNTEHSTCSSKLVRDLTTGAKTPKCSESLPQLKTPMLKSGGSSTDPETTCVGDRVASCSENANVCDEEPFATDDEDMDSDEQSRAPTPWPERWYEGGSELGLQQFAAQIIADCLCRYENAEAGSDEFGTAQCPADNESRQHGHEQMGVTTTGASSTAGQTTYVGRKSSSGHSTKRPRSNDDEDKDEDRSPKRREAKRPPDSDANARKFYACPYQKRNPQQSPLCGLPHGSKRDFGWDNVSRVKYVSVRTSSTSCWRDRKFAC